MGLGALSLRPLGFCGPLRLGLGPGHRVGTRLGGLAALARLGGVGPTATPGRGQTRGRDQSSEHECAYRAVLVLLCRGTPYSGAPRQYLYCPSCAQCDARSDHAERHALYGGAESCRQPRCPGRAHRESHGPAGAPYADRGDASPRGDAQGGSAGTRTPSGGVPSCCSACRREDWCQGAGTPGHSTSPTCSRYNAPATARGYRPPSARTPA